ncbi:MAG TPA: hypothetical protein VHD34_08645 [Xanthobacteraceae bacterium]|nr:hypothetical protein [Xanthobacteraceae bacterium]
MQNGRRSTTDEKLDEALEDTFPSSDPVSISRPETRQGAPKQHSETAAQAVKETAKKTARSVADAAQTVKNRIAEKAENRPDYLWLGGAFVLGAIFGLAARSAPSAFGSRSYADRLFDRGERLQRRVSSRVSDMQLKRKLEDLLERLQ